MRARAETHSHSTEVIQTGLCAQTGAFKPVNVRVTAGSLAIERSSSCFCQCQATYTRALTLFRGESDESFGPDDGRG